MVDVTFNPTEIQSSQGLYVKVQTVPMKHVMVPDRRRLTYTFENGNTESYHLNNFKSTICKQITRTFDNEVNATSSRPESSRATRIYGEKALGWERLNMA